MLLQGTRHERNPFVRLNRPEPRYAETEVLSKAEWNVEQVSNLLMSLAANVIAIEAGIAVSADLRV
jgi:hypothetical protein